ncbi:MAG: phosphatidylinositol-specific phospholipase C/glycerophosphodiester phosphodiesterase family protein [Bacteroidota bacterium]
MRKELTGALIFLCLAFVASAQYTTINAHSHNDYEQKIPFYLAYNARFGSIEADIWAINGELFVAHNKSAIAASKTLDILYIQPIVELFKKNGGKVSSDISYTFQLMIDLKTEVEPTLSLLTEKLKKYPEVFDPAVNKNAVRITITGNRPEPTRFKDYPVFISFDGNVSKRYDPEQLKRVALYSENLVVFTKWRATEAIPEKEEVRLKQIIDSVHGINKKIRFWNAPDTQDAWKILMGLGVDFINTDHIPELSTFLKTIKTN